MANQKGTLHSVPLKTVSLNLNRFNADIAPYEGFNKNNSPFFGNVLSPFYKANVQGLGSETYVAKDGLIYYYGNDGNFYLKSGTEDKLLNNLSGKNFLQKEEIYTLGNEHYSTILGFVSYPKGYVSTKDLSLALCSDREGNLNLIHTSGSLRGQPLKSRVSYISPDVCKIKPGEKIHYIRALLDVPGNSVSCTGYVVGLQDRTLIIKTWSNEAKITVAPLIRTPLIQTPLLSTPSSYKTNQSFFYTGDTNHPSYFTTVYGTYGLLGSEPSSRIPVSKAIKLITDDSLTAVVTTSGTTLSNIMVDYNGNVSFYGTEYKIQQADNQWRVCETGVIQGYESDGTLVINIKGYSLTSDIDHLKIQLLDSDHFSQYCSDVVVGVKTDGYTKITPGTYKTVLVPIIETTYTTLITPNGAGGYITNIIPVVQVVGYNEVKEYSGDVKTQVPGSYYVKLHHGKEL